MDSKQAARPRHIRSPIVTPSSQPLPISSSVPIKSPLLEVLQLSGSLQSVDTLIEDALLEDEGGDVDAHLTCKSLVGGKLAFQPFYRELDEVDFEGREDCEEDAENKERTSSLESSDETTASVSINDDEEIPPQHDQSILRLKDDPGYSRTATDAVTSLDSTTPTTQGAIPAHFYGKNLLPESPFPEPLSFELVEARIFREGPANRRFVLYTIVVHKSETNTASRIIDTNAITLEKRFSDFDNLHTSLNRSVAAALSGISIPPKRLFKNFDAKTIAERSRAFEQYLSHISLDNSVRATTAFGDFFYGVDLADAFDLLSRLCFVNALPSLHRILSVASMVVGAGHRHVFLSLCALAAVYHEMEEEGVARQHAEAGVDWLKRFGWESDDGEASAALKSADLATGDISPWEKRKRKEGDGSLSSSSAESSSSSARRHKNSVFHLGFTYNILTTPLIELTIRLRWKLGIDKRELEKVLEKIEKDPSFVKERKKTLLQAVLCLKPEL